MSSPDVGPNPHVVNIEEKTLTNDTFRTALWTGRNLQVTVMAIHPGDDVGLEVHDDHDQFLRIEQGTARVQMGPGETDLPFDREVSDDWSVMVPAGTWHNLTNSGDDVLKLYSIYAPAEHPHGTVHQDKAEADEYERSHHH